ncbi:MAG: site-2 protease family protein [Firmicutes bacterium]|nr:hypothetical protein [Clostridiales bacterium]MBQ9931391.1 site-2 protease family protein [Bacillota bacterium]
MLRFSLFGIRTEIHFSFFLLAFLLLLTGNGGVFLLGAVLFSFGHELTHGLAAKAMGLRPAMISAGLFGGVLQMEEGSIPPLKELFLHLSGPLFNLLWVLVFYGLWDRFGQALWADLLLGNLILGCFNLMPFYPLDGGKIVNLYLSWFFGYRVADRLSQIFSLFFSLSLFLLGIYLVQYNVMNLLISGLALNLYVAAREDRRFHYDRLKHIYTEIEGNYCK